MIKKEFLFCKRQRGRRRSQEEIFHDILVVSKQGLGKTRIMFEANLSWVPMLKILKRAHKSGLIEETSVFKYGVPGNRSLGVGWMTTEKGLRYVRNVYHNYILLQTEEEREILE